MNSEGRRGTIIGPVLLLVVLLALSALACAQAGEVLTPEEATRRAEAPGDVGPSGEAVESAGEGLDVGDTATLAGTGFLINMFDEPDGRLVANQERGAIVTIDDVRQVENVTWYQVTAATGQGWVPADSLQVVEGETEPVVVEEEVDESGIGIGDTVYLTGRGFLINLYDAPGGRLRANQERGAQVEVLERATADDGAVWYRIDAPTGEGWVAAENLTVEAP